MGKIIWLIAFTLMAGSLSGAQIGVRLAEKLDPRHVKKVLRIVTIVLIIQLNVNSIL